MFFFCFSIRAIVVPNGEKKRFLIYFIDFPTHILIILDEVPYSRNQQLYT